MVKNPKNTRNTFPSVNLVHLSIRDSANTTDALPQKVTHHHLRPTVFSTPTPPTRTHTYSREISTLAYTQPRIYSRTKKEQCVGMRVRARERVKMLPRVRAETARKTATAGSAMARASRAINTGP